MLIQILEAIFIVISFGLCISSFVIAKKYDEAVASLVAIAGIILLLMTMLVQ